MDIFVPRRPLERLYLMSYDSIANTSNYREVSVLGWRAGYYVQAIPIGLQGEMRINEGKSAWVVELAEGRFASPQLGIGLFNTMKDVFRLLIDQFHKWAESSE